MISVLASTSDIELSELAESINRMASQLQRQFQEREALLQAVSHEMGTPLSRMRFAIEFLEERASGEETDKRMRALSADLDELASPSQPRQRQRSKDHCACELGSDGGDGGSSPGEDQHEADCGREADHQRLQPARRSAGA